MTASKLARHKDNSAQTYLKYAIAYFSSYIRPCQRFESTSSDDSSRDQHDHGENLLNSGVHASKKLNGAFLILVLLIPSAAAFSSS